MKMQQILEVDFKFSNRKAAMEDARTNSWIVKSVGSSSLMMDGTTRFAGEL